MSDSAEEIVRRMQALRSEVSDDVHGIVQSAKTLTNWRYQVKIHPWAAVGLAFGAGLFLAPKRRHFPSVEAKELLALLKKRPGALAAPMAVGSGGLLRTVMGLAGPLMARKAMTMVQNRLAGFNNSNCAAASQDRDDATATDFHRPR